MSKNYETSALAFSAFLHSTSRLRYLRVVPTTEGVGMFVFADPNEEAEALKKDFEARKCFVEPRAFHLSLRVLRAEIEGVAGKTPLPAIIDQREKSGRVSGGPTGVNVSREAP